MTSLKDKTVFITGATSGFGEACAHRFAKEGCKLILIGRRKERLEKLAHTLKVQTNIMQLDVRDQKAVSQAIEGLPSEFQHIDVLINNAGCALGLGPAHKALLDDWEEMVDTNIKGVMYCTSAILPGMVERNRGHIVNMGSMAGTYPYPGGNVYGATKAFLKQFSLNLRADLLGTNVRVTNIEPGMADTEFSLVRFHGNKQKADQVYDGMQPLTAEDIAESVLWSVGQPAHVNINRIEIMPVAQASGPLAIHRKV